jgi:peptidoglycan/LPS O-acetylase OafA/YrhL
MSSWLFSLHYNRLSFFLLTMLTSLINNNNVSEKAKATAVPLLRHTLRFLVPSFLSKHEPSIMRRTDFLDGMRGFACVVVFVSHCVPSFFPYGKVGFWSINGTRNDNYITQLPIIRLTYAGTSMVLIFFVLSGFSITLKPLKLARQGASDLLYNNLVSATFRRAGRLYFPCVALMLLVFLQSFLGCFIYSDDMLEKWPFLNDQVPVGLRLETGRLWRFCQSFWMWGDPVCIFLPF